VQAIAWAVPGLLLGLPVPTPNMLPLPLPVLPESLRPRVCPARTGRQWAMAGLVCRDGCGRTAPTLRWRFALHQFAALTCTAHVGRQGLARAKVS
jgi:hypothetical protein